MPHRVAFSVEGEVHEKVEPIRELDDIDRMKNYLKSKSERNYILFLVGIYSGLRVSDIVPLQVKHVVQDRIEIKEKKNWQNKKICS